MVTKVQLFVHRDRRPAHRDRHDCQYGRSRDACGNGVIRWTVTIRPLPEANGYDFAQEIHYVRKKRPTVKRVEVKGNARGSARMAARRPYGIDKQHSLHRHLTKTCMLQREVHTMLMYFWKIMSM